MVEDHFLEKPVFDPFLTHFLVPKSPFSRLLGTFHGPKRCHHGLKMGQKHLFEHPKWSRIAFEKNVFLTHFGPIFGLETAHFQGILAFSMAENVSPRAQNGLKTLV